jgi:hypothetical protein
MQFVDLKLLDRQCLPFLEGNDSSLTEPSVLRKGDCVQLLFSIIECDFTVYLAYMHGTWHPETFI